MMKARTANMYSQMMGSLYRLMDSSAVAPPLSYSWSLALHQIRNYATSGA
jgi:hypothetical protein